MADITPILMPKWGLSMKEGKLAAWHVAEGAEIKPGDEIMDVETDKIANVVEAADGGLLRRRIGVEGETYPVRALLAVMAPPSVAEDEIDAYVAAYETPSAGDDEGEEGPSYQFADLPAGRIRYAERPGEGVPLILIHGFGGDLDNWLFNIDALAENAPVYALDLPGHGQSVKSARPAGLELMVQTVIAFMDHLGIDKAHLAGHSMGGLVAGTLAAQHPARVASVTLICSAGLGSEINSDYIDGFVRAAGRKDLKPVLAHLFKDQSLVSRAMVEDLLKYKRLDGVQDFLTELAGSLFREGRQAQQVAEALAASGVPAQVIWGEADAVIPAAHAESLQGASRHVVSGAGHMVQMEQSAEVNRLIRDFIA
ncbi:MULTISPECIES: acetoin dehydrogenase dihydrolipoyllysine-residue acetyltransferase subunit [Paracoccus]|jgi:pyruvate dehydrogenase E2 component (dihydrolipoamide acetyltransferase)|uniref:acetoin dehydrogenase dihydrolipoyllysine-residue acetyltransferase subunit n=1 Tax=Paracoccus TaxID=265 RepID=UPI001E65DC3B|nr:MULTISPECIES: acetoin dehydrogenase dihydrolipoyllysine-residue acetyltransferase subunit [Paracoccus]MDK8873794.1 acetoin dehydrogenase dihydrolipoyllysine-residue acetyltransferase subunit [Paracoccus sp. SSJ]UFS68054.1 acetoin dehydrogenase dihydrolipoyllysine-residue acetyltransferase subunit [Paracoccus denitrificans]